MGDKQTPAQSVHNKQSGVALRTPTAMAASIFPDPMCCRPSRDAKRTSGTIEQGRAGQINGTGESCRALMVGLPDVCLPLAFRDDGQS